MRSYMFAAAAAAAWIASPASAAAILGLYNTGVTDGGDGWGAGDGAKPGNGADLHWSADGGNGGHAFTGSPIVPTWLANDAVSQWLTLQPQGDQSLDPDADGSYVFTTSFDLTGFDPSTASFDGRFAADNLVSAIRLNGELLSGAGGGFTDWTGFAAASGFVGGVNRLEFVLTNLAQPTGNPAGLRVEFLNSSVSPFAAIPEPTTWAMLILGFGLIGAARRARVRRVSYALS